MEAESENVYSNGFPRPWYAYHILCCTLNSRAYNLIRSAIRGQLRFVILFFRLEKKLWSSIYVWGQPALLLWTNHNLIGEHLPWLTIHQCNRETVRWQPYLGCCVAWHYIYASYHIKKRYGLSNDSFYWLS